MSEPILTLLLERDALVGVLSPHDTLTIVKEQMGSLATSVPTFEVQEEALFELPGTNDRTKLGYPYYQWPTTWIELIGVENLYEIEQEFMDIYYSGWESRATLAAALRTNPHMGCCIRLLAFIVRNSLYASRRKHQNTPPRSRKAEDDARFGAWYSCVRETIQLIGTFILIHAMMPLFYLYMGISLPLIGLLYVCAVPEGCRWSCCTCNQRDAVYADILQQHAEHTPLAVAIMTYTRLHAMKLKWQQRLPLVDINLDKWVEAVEGPKGDDVCVTYQLRFYAKGTAPAEENINTATTCPFMRCVTYEGFEYEYRQPHTDGASLLPTEITSISQLQPLFASFTAQQLPHSTKHADVAVAPASAVENVYALTADTEVPTEEHV